MSQDTITAKYGPLTRLIDNNEAAVREFLSMCSGLAKNATVRDFSESKLKYAILSENEIEVRVDEFDFDKPSCTIDKLPGFMNDGGVVICNNGLSEILTEDVIKELISSSPTAMEVTEAINEIKLASSLSTTLELADTMALVKENHVQGGTLGDLIKKVAERNAKVVARFNNSDRNVLEVTLDPNDEEPIETINELLSIHSGSYSKHFDAMNVVTSKFSPTRIIYEHEGFVIAKGKWLDDEYAIACRYHDETGLGYPNGMGKPQWMQLPTAVVAENSHRSVLLENEITLRFRGNLGKVEVGSWVKSEGSWHLVVYCYGEKDEMVQAIGLGKKDSYPITYASIEEVRHGESILSKWHKGKIFMWLSPDGYMFRTHQEGPNTFSITEMHRSSTSAFNDSNVKWRGGNRATLAYFYQLNGLVRIGSFDDDQWDKYFGSDAIKTGLSWINECFDFAKLNASISSLKGTDATEFAEESSVKLHEVLSCDKVFGDESYWDLLKGEVVASEIV